MTNPAADPILTLTVFGTPQPGGSKKPFAVYAGSGNERRFTGRINVTDDSEKRNKPWRQAIVDATHKLIMCSCPDQSCTKLRDGFPLDEPLVLTAVFTVAKPASAPKGKRSWPDRRPDVLKLLRPVEDALKDAGLYADDARIIRYRDLAKVYPREDPDALDVPGVRISVWRQFDLVAWQRDAVVADPVGTLFDT